MFPYRNFGGYDPRLYDLDAYNAFAATKEKERSNSGSGSSSDSSSWSYSNPTPFMLPVPQIYRQPHYFPPRSSPSYSSSNLRIVRQDPDDGGACSVCAMACVSGVNYVKVFNTAIDHGFRRAGGMSWRAMEATLDELGVSNTRYSSTPDWNKLPDLAIIPVYGINTQHAVVFERRSNGAEYIYDNNNFWPVGTSGYRIDHSASYIKINKAVGGPYA